MCSAEAAKNTFERVRILAIDASTEACSVSLQIPGRRYSRSSSTPRAHAQALLPMIDEVLSEASLNLSELDALAIVNGPGSFTGLRIALSVLQGLAYGTNLPVYTASSLEVMASCFYPSKNSSDAETLVVPALDARMDEVYWGAYLVGPKGVFTEKIPARVTALVDFKEELEKLAESMAIFGLGEFFSSERMALKSLHGVDFSCAPSAEALLEALPKFPSQRQDILQVEPLYLRNEVAWKKRTRIRQQAIT